MIQYCLFLSMVGVMAVSPMSYCINICRRHIKFKDYRCIWAIKHHKKKNISIENAKVIEYFSIPYFFYLARSQYWIANCKLPMYVLKKPNQIYLQTWHGTPF